MTDTRTFVRRWSFVLAVAFAAFAAYISFVPFRFENPGNFQGMVDLFWRRFETTMTSRGNFLANMLLCAPVGFFGLATFVTPATRWWRRAVAVAVVLTASILLSLVIEFVQTIVPGRTPSAADITAQTLGAGAAIVMWLLLCSDVHAVVDKWGAGQVGAKASNWVALLTGYTILRAVVILLPLDVTVDLGVLLSKFRHGLIVINPLTSSDWLLENLPNTMADAALAIPVGVLAALGIPLTGLRPSRSQAIAIGAVWFGLIETAEVFIQSRTADSADLLVNVAGVIMGVLIVEALAPAEAPRASTRRNALPWLALAGLTVALGLYVVYNWLPFDFNVDPRFIRSRAHMLVGVPFFGYYINPEFKAITDIVVKLSMAAPIGLFLRRAIAPGSARSSRVLRVALIAVAVVFFSAVEAGQVLLATRYPDDTDILLALGGTWIGWRLSELWSRPRSGHEESRAVDGLDETLATEVDARDDAEDADRRSRLLQPRRKHQRR